MLLPPVDCQYYSEQVQFGHLKAGVIAAGVGALKRTVGQRTDADPVPDLPSRRGFQATLLASLAGHQLMVQTQPQQAGFSFWVRCTIKEFNEGNHGRN
jgi:hypothetical protein